MTFTKNFPSKLYRGVGLVLMTVLMVGTGAMVAHANFHGGDDDKGSVKITKVVVGGTAHWWDFSLKVGNTSVLSGVKKENIPVGTYQVTETGPTQNYVASFSGDCDEDGSITITKNKTSSCTLTNTYITPKGHITLVKIVAGDGAPDAATAWTLSASGSTGISGVTGDPSITNAEVLPGLYILSENGGPDGYTPSDWVCTGTHGNNGNTVNIAPGDNETCTITNTFDPGSITIEKEVQGAGEQQYPSGWTFDFSGSWSFSLNDGSPSVVENNLVPGSYTITEGALPANWYFVSADCGDVNTSPLENGVSVSLGLGQQVVCTFTNEYRAPKGPTATVDAQKVICDAEQYLPNWGGGADDITPDTAQNWVNQSEGHCSLASDWSFEYNISGNEGNPGGTVYGPKGGNWVTFTADGDTATAQIDITDVNLIQMREVLQGGFIPFSDNNNDNVSAEFYCASDVAGYDNWEWIQNPQNDTTYHCVGFNAPKENMAHIVATKIVCPTEAELPNWGAGGSDINADTASTFLSAHPACHLAPDWTFQWAPAGTDNPGDNLEAAGDPWTAFGPTDGSGVVTLDVTVPEGDSPYIWMREELKNGYIPFTGLNSDQDVSAEIYCNTDVLHYDNYDRVDNLAAGQTYYCVAWNVPNTCRVDVVSAVGDDGVGNGDAVAAWVHSAWTHALESVATWIWDTQYVQNPSIDEAKTFTKDFYVTGPVTDATLNLAADNRYWITINSIPVVSNTGEHNYEAVTGPIDVSSYLAPGWNTITLKVENIGINGSSATDNPAAGIYQLVINANSPVQCEQPEKPPVETNRCAGGDNLLGNGGFETPIVTNPQLWDLFPEGTPGLVWDVRNISGNPSPLAEIQAGVNGWIADEGTQYAELDSTEGTALSQDISTTPDQEYDLKFVFSPRPGRADTDNSLDVFWGGTFVGTVGPTDGTSLLQTDWTPESFVVTATSTDTRLEFRYTGTSNSYGSFVDDVCLTQKQIGGGGEEGNGTIVIKKEVTEGSDTEKNFNFYLTDYYDAEQTHIEDFQLSVGGETQYDLPSGVYSISEILDSHWTQDSAVCVSNLDQANEDAGQVGLSSGEIVTCTFVNDQTEEGNDGDNDGDGDTTPQVESFSGGGSSGGGSHRLAFVSDDTAGGEVLGAQTSVVPAGAPNTGAGGMAETGNALGALFTLLGGLGLFVGKKRE